ncbi:MAG: FG-GAP repeat domain-containing protein [Thermomicrobiales bacterium]
MSGRLFRFDRRTYLRAMAALPAGLALGTLGSERVLAAPPTFSIANVPVGAVPRSLAIGDVNNDGSPDVAVANFNAGTVNVLLNDGHGNLTNAPGSPITFPAANLVHFADFNLDGKRDLVVLNLQNGVLHRRLGNGDGTFGPIVTSPVPNNVTDFVPILLYTSPHIGIAMTVGASSTPGASNTVQIYSGDGLGGFTPKSHASTGTTPIAIATTILTNGTLLIATANYDAGNVSVFKQQTDDSLSPVPGSPFAVGTQPASQPFGVTFGNFGGIGTPGLVSTNFGDNTFTSFHVLNSGACTLAQTAGTGQGPFSPALGDFNGDGKPDLVITAFTGNTVGFHIGNGDGTFGGDITIDINNALRPTDLAVTDLNGDGRPDFLTANQESNNVTVALNTTTPYAKPSPFLIDVTPAMGSSSGGTRFTLKCSGAQQGAVVKFAIITRLGESFDATDVVVSPDGKTITGLTPDIGPILNASGITGGIITIINPDGQSSFEFHESYVDALFIFTSQLPVRQPGAPVIGEPNPVPVVQPVGAPVPGVPNPVPVVQPGGPPGGGVPAPIPTHR